MGFLSRKLRHYSVIVQLLECARNTMRFPCIKHDSSDLGRMCFTLTSCFSWQLTSTLKREREKERGWRTVINYTCMKFCFNPVGSMDKEVRLPRISSVDASEFFTFNKRTSNSGRGKNLRVAVAGGSSRACITSLERVVLIARYVQAS